MLNANEHRLSVNEKLRTRSGALRTSEHFTYAGMVNDDTFSVVLSFFLGNNAWSYNLYFSRDQREIKLWDVRLHVLSVSSREIHFRVDDN
ncbi:MAG: hypothetical protein P1R58_08620 [bacterium]|nr:hypothetical protein [bacterium]